eukprot:1785193-Alexandrium_andersonii.AAC.1
MSGQSHSGQPLAGKEVRRETPRADLPLYPVLFDGRQMYVDAASFVSPENAADASVGIGYDEWDVPKGS